MADTIKRHRVLVAGAGAAGMAAALRLAQAGVDVALLEANDMPGRKILATGNGKCNFTNEFQSPECYRGEQPQVAEGLLKRYGPAYVLRFFEGLGIPSRQRDGYYYPDTGQAATVRDAFALRLFEYHVPIYCNTHVDRVEKAGCFLLSATQREKLPAVKLPTGKLPAGKGKKPGKPVFSEGREVLFTSEYVILATGGCAGNIRGADGSGYAIASGLGHRIVPVVPALVQLKLAPPKAAPGIWNILSGTRAQAQLSLRIVSAGGGRQEWRERGEILFTDYGISGIPTMQVSRFAAREFAQEGRQGRVEAELDFFPDIPEEELARRLVDRFRKFPRRSLADLLLGLLPSALNLALIAALGLSPDEVPQGGGNRAAFYASKFAGEMKRFAAEVEGTNGFEHAQAVAGGVALCELFPETMESRLVEGLYIAGELADIDGTCGGYNLQWAFMSGFAAAEAICGKEGK